MFAALLPRPVAVLLGELIAEATLKLMKSDQVFDSGEARAADFKFNEQVADVFDDMVSRSVPYYEEQQRMIREISKAFWLPGTCIYDLGCATGTTAVSLSRELPGASIVGYDNSWPMIHRANQKVEEAGLEERISLRYGDLNGNLEELPIENATVATLCWTLQFVRPLRRDNLIRHIYESLADNGALVVTEKVLFNGSPTNRFFIDFYYDYKRRHGYSELEIANKREALENVMVPYRMDENLELFRRSGFEIVETFFQWYNLAGFLCVKKPAMRSGPSRQAGG